MLLWDPGDGSLTVIAAERESGWAVSIPVPDGKLALEVLARPLDFDRAVEKRRVPGSDVWERVRSAQASYARRQERRRRTGTSRDTA